MDWLALDDTKKLVMQPLLTLWDKVGETLKHTVDMFRMLAVHIKVGYSHNNRDDLWGNA